MPNLPKIIQNDFKTCGISLFSSEAVDFNVLSKKRKNRENQQSI